MTVESPKKLYVVAALYKFVTLDDYQDLRAPLLEKCKEYDVIGTLLLANEGINGTIASDRTGIDQILAYLRSDPRFADIEHKESITDCLPFFRMRVRLKKEIVTLKVPDVDPNKAVGTYVDSREWNNLLNDPSVIVIDTRNDYEYDVGTFKGAINPKTKSFGEFPQFVKNNLEDKKDRKIAMFCTGGIRCEKASSFMLAKGFPEVYHLKGGILKYLEDTPKSESLWQGECFVFDHRVSVGHDDFKTKD